MSARAVTLLLSIAAAQAGTRADAQVLPSMQSELIARESSAPATRAFVTAVEDAHADRVRLDDGLERALNSVVVSDDDAAPEPLFSRPGALPSALAPMAPAPLTLDDCLDGCAPSAGRRNGPRFYGQIDVMFLMRKPRYANQPLVVDATTGATVLSTSDLDEEINPALRTTLGVQFCCGRALELSYFGLFQGSSSGSSVTAGDGDFLIFPGNFFGNVFVGFDGAAISSSTSLNGLEANLPCMSCCDDCSCGDCCSEVQAPVHSFDWFGGLRYINLDDELNINPQRTVNGAVEQGNYNVRTSNNLYGVQLGARLRRAPRPFGWEATGRAGIFGNDAKQEQTVTDFPDFPIRPTVSRSGGSVAFVGELNLTGLYRLTDVWNLRAGYSLIWIEGVALAPDQLDFNFATAPSGDQLNRDGGMLLHGANLGLEAGW